MSCPPENNPLTRVSPQRAAERDSSAVDAVAGARDKAPDRRPLRSPAVRSAGGTAGHGGALRSVQGGEVSRAAYCHIPRPVNWFWKEYRRPARERGVSASSLRSLG